jgi:redox-sensitive bicupin YhaK (pirin superfamily)
VISDISGFRQCRLVYYSSVEGKQNQPIMISVRKASDRGHANYGWLDTYYTFSFNDYYDPRHMGFRDLRVINEDFIDPAKGFPMHGHSDMEIITYVISGDLSHKDSMGNGTTIKPHEIQRMSAGTGVLHSEFSSPTQKTHLLQIWIFPEKRGVEPSYEQILFPPSIKEGCLKLVASRDGSEGSVSVNQDVKLYASILKTGEEVEHKLSIGRHAWIQIVHGTIDVNGMEVNRSDGIAISEETLLKIKAKDDCEFLLFDLR